MPYNADATQLEPDSIVKVERPASSSGKPTYPHFFIVPTIFDPVKIADLIPLVGTVVATMNAWTRRTST